MDSLRALTLARGKALQIEAVLISICCTYAEHKVTDPWLTKLVTDTSFWSNSRNASDCHCHSPTGTAETPALVPDEQAIEPQSIPQFFPEGGRCFFFLGDRLFIRIKRPHPDLSSWAPNLSPQEQTSAFSRSNDKQFSPPVREENLALLEC